MVLSVHSFNFLLSGKHGAVQTVFEDPIMNTTVHASIDEETKNNAAAVLRGIGLSASDAVRLMLL